MQPFEFIIPARPVSQQTRRRERIHEWKRFVADCAKQYGTSTHTRADGPVAVQIIYLCEEAAVDLDNILKPFIDALIGLALDGDRQSRISWRGGGPFALIWHWKACLPHWHPVLPSVVNSHVLRMPHRWRNSHE